MRVPHYVQLGGVVLLILAAAGAGDEHSAGVAIRSSRRGTKSEEEEQRKQCWVFTHMNKSGGQTVKGILKPYVEDRGISTGLYDWQQWNEGTSYVTEYLAEKNTITWGGYTEALRPHGAGQCKWFTVFRHPVARLVSAYFYCKQTPGDHLCGSTIARAEEMDIVTFAKHWTNFGLRQFALSFVSPEDVMSSRSAFDCPTCPDWYLVREYLNEAHRKRSRAYAPDAGMYKYLEPVQAVLGSKYAAVGILEQYNSTLELFNRALGFPGLDWSTAFRQHGVQNNLRENKDAEHEALRLAWTDLKIKKYLRLDLLLYEHAVSVNRQQRAQYGLL
ncbi:unnamed protein product [Sphacelaria rigidula]